MQTIESAVVAVVDKLNEAAMGAAQWEDALSLLATSMSARACQLIGFNERSSQFNLMGGLEHGVTAEIERLGGVDPAMNPRMAAGLTRPVLHLITDADIITTRERRRHPFFNDVVAKLDLPYICATTLARDPLMNVGLAALRSTSQGEMDNVERTYFSQLALHVRSAVRLQALVNNRGAALIAGALRQLGIAGFVCDRRGLVKAMTPQAEAMVGDNGTLTLRAGTLRTRCQRESEQLATAIAAAAQGKPETPANSFVFGNSGRHEQAGWLDIVALPPLPYEFNFEPCALVVARGQDQSHTGVPSALLQSRYRLTAAEADVALQLASGLSLQAIAEQRGRSRETVRFQAKAIYSKLGVRGQPELAALLARWTPSEGNSPQMAHSRASS